LARLVRPNDLLLFSANLAPDPDYAAGQATAGAVGRQTRRLGERVCGDASLVGGRGGAVRGPIPATVRTPWP